MWVGALYLTIYVMFVTLNIMVQVTVRSLSKITSNTDDKPILIVFDVSILVCLFWQRENRFLCLCYAIDMSDNVQYDVIMSFVV